MHQNETIDSLANEYLQKEGSDYMSILSDMKKKGYDQDTTMKVFERYEKLRSNRLDEKTVHLIDKEKKRLQREKRSAEWGSGSGWSVLIGMVCFVASYAAPFTLVTNLIILIGSVAIGYLMDKKSPWAGMMGSLVFFLLIGYVMPMYLEGRTRVMKIEAAIPAFIALLPAYLVYYVIRNFNKKH